MKKNSTPLDPKRSEFLLYDQQGAEQVARNLQILCDFTGLPFEPYYDSDLGFCVNAKFELAGLSKDVAESLIRKRFYPDKGIQAGKKLLEVVQSGHHEETKVNFFVIVGIDRRKLSGSPDKYFNADRIIALGDQLANRDKFLNEQFNELYSKIVEKQKVLIAFRDKYKQDTELKFSSKAREVLVKYITNIFDLYKELQEINYTSGDNQSKSGKLIEEISGIIYDIYIHLGQYFMQRGINVRDPNLDEFVENVNKILERAVITAEHFKLLGTENLLVKSFAFLRMHAYLQVSGHSGNYDYLLKMREYIKNHLKKPEGTCLKVLDQQLLYSSIFECHRLDKNFLAALGNYDELLKSYHNSSGQEKIDLSMIIVENRQRIISLFDALLSQNYPPELLLERAENLYSLRQFFQNSRTWDERLVSGEMSLNMRNSRSKVMAGLEQLLKNFIDKAKKLCPNIKNTEKNKKAKKIKKAKEVKEAQPQETNKSKPLLSSVVLLTTKSQQELCPLPKAEPCQPVLSPPAPPPATLRIPEAEIQRNKEIKRNKYHANTHKIRKNKNDADTKEPKTEETVYELKAHATADVVKAMIASHFLKTLPIHLAQSAIKILSRGWMDRDGGVKAVTPRNRKKYTLSTQYTHQIIINPKEDKRLNETYRIFAQWRTDNNKERCLEFDYIFPKIK